jgi:membrane-associated phospholipid phosphatase
VHDPTNKFSGTLSPGTEKLAKIISLVEQPPFLSIPAFVLICMLLSEDQTTGIICSVASIFAATVLPIVNIAYFSKRYGNTDKLDVVNKEQRFIPLVVGVMGYFIGVVLLYFLNAPNLATVLMLCYALVTAAILIITPYWKISIHSCGVVGPSMALAVGFWPYGLLYFLLLPPVIWSRYVLQKHTPLQLLMGAVVGFVITAVLFILLL